MRNPRPSPLPRNSIPARSNACRSASSVRARKFRTGRRPRLKLVDSVLADERCFAGPSRSSAKTRAWLCTAWGDHAPRSMERRGERVLGRGEDAEPLTAVLGWRVYKSMSRIGLDKKGPHTTPRSDASLCARWVDRNRRARPMSMALGSIRPHPWIAQVDRPGSGIAVTVEAGQATRQGASSRRYRPRWRRRTRTQYRRPQGRVGGW